MSALSLYTSCTQTKSVSPEKILCAGALKGDSVFERHAVWRDRIDGWNGKRRTARDLYRGGHWSVVREIAESRRDLRCSVISAGYGLIPMDAKLAPYAATFAFGKEDSITRATGALALKENIEWWNRLCAWKPIGIDGARSLKASVSASPREIHLFALSPFYLDAIFEDLLCAREQLPDPSRLIVISGAKRRYGELNRSVVHAPAALQTVLGGGLVSLNVRVAAEVIKRIPMRDLTPDEVRTFVTKLASTAKVRVYPKRDAASDDEVLYFLEKAIKRQEKPSYTNLLRSFRNSGRACEIKRFKQLFQRIISA